MSSPYDVLIIGSGAGGGTLAHRLALAGKKILILERGSFLLPGKNNWNSEAIFLDNCYHTSEVWQDGEGHPLHPQTGYWIGGNTKVFGAALFRLREKDFEEVHHKGGVSPAWPLKYKDFEPYYTQAEKLYHVHGRQGLDPTEPFRSEDFPYPPISNEPVMQNIEDNVRKLGLHPFPTPLGIQLNEANSADSKCIRCDTCDAYPCLVHAKSDAEVCCLRPILHLPNVTLMTETRVTRLLTDSTGQRVTAVEALTKDSDKPVTFSADLIVVSCGAINSAALLLKSANDRHPRGLANSSDQVGRNFMYHQADAILAVRREQTRGIYMKTVSVNDFYFGTKDYPYPMGNIQPLGSLHFEMIKADAPFFTPDFIMEWMSQRAIPWWLMTEDLPDPDNRVEIKNGRISLSYKANNQESYFRLRDTWISVLKQAGHADHWAHLRAYFKKRVPLEGVGHQNGTCRFGSDPQRSVLDLNCKAHDLDNLYVVDASFFPSCGAVNPALTVMANALRVGDHMLERLKARTPSHAEAL